MAEIESGLLTEYISHPGDTLIELLEQYGISQKELAVKTDTSEKHINEIIKGKKGISVSFAKKLEDVLPPSASFWINRQNIYDEKLEETRNIRNITDKEKDLVKRFPVKELVKYGYIKEDKDDISNVLALRKFASTINLEFVPIILNVILPQVNFKLDNSTTVDEYHLYSWLRICQIETEKMNNPYPYDVNKLKESILEIKKCSLEKDFNFAYQKVSEILKKCGINFKIVKNLKSNPVQEYIRIINNNVSMCVTLKWHYEDVFWFTLFHEIGHLLTKRNNRIFIDFTSSEFKANEFAKNTLISKSSWCELLSKPLSETRIKECAKSNSVCPAVIVGRLKKEGHISYNDNSYNHLQRKIDLY